MNYTLYNCNINNINLYTLWYDIIIIIGYQVTLY